MHEASYLHRVHKIVTKRVYWMHNTWLQMMSSHQEGEKREKYKVYLGLLGVLEREEESVSYILHE